LPSAQDCAFVADAVEIRLRDSLHVSCSG
jgi:hypothetical protein